MTKEMVVTLLEHLDRLGIGMSSGDTIHKQESTRSHALLVSVISAAVEIGAGSLKYKDSDFDIYTGSAGFLFPAD